MTSETKYLMAIDQGSTSTRAMIFDVEGRVIGKQQKEITQYYPKDGWVEHDGMEIILTVKDTIRDVLQKIPEGCFPASVGITNQRETTLIWDRQSGKPIYPAIVWQDRRTADLCQKMIEDGLESIVNEKTGLLLDPYFSATKIKWILDNVSGARKRANRGELAFGTVDSFILWHLTKGKIHATDVTNASRTMLFNIRDMAWDTDLLKMFDVPAEMLPEVYACDHHFGDVDKELFGQSFPITAIAGDQHAALIGQNCFSQGQVKCTFGTGGFVIMNTGDKIIRSENRLLTTVAYQIKDTVAYALEGSFFSAGSAVQWLRDGLKIIKHAGETEILARSIDDCKGVFMVPAFTGLGAPYWDPKARGSIFGLTRASGVAEIVRATLESVGFQAADLLEAIAKDSNLSLENIKVDGGMVVNEWFLQFLADIMNMEVLRPIVTETTAYGVAMLSGIGAGIFDTINDISIYYQYDSVFIAKMMENDVISKRRNWNNAVKTTQYYSIQQDGVFLFTNSSK